MSQSRTCCVKNCGSNSNEHILFQFPKKDSENYKVWLNVIGEKLKEGRSDRIYLFICDLHFAENCFRQDKTEINSDGMEVIVPRQRFGLVAGSVPSIFRENSEHSNQSAFASISENASQGGNLSAVMAPKGRYSNAALIKDWNSMPFEKIPKHWTMVETNGGVLLGYYGDTLKSETRSILVRNNMTTKIRARGRIAKFPTLEKISCFQDAYSAVLTVTMLQMCDGSNSQTHCSVGFFVRKQRSSSNRCKVCQITRKRENDKERNRKQRLSARSVRDRIRLKNLRKRLQLDIDELSPVSRKEQAL